MKNKPSSTPQHSSAPKHTLGKIGYGFDTFVDGVSNLAEGVNDITVKGKDKLIDILSVEKPKSGGAKARNKAVKYFGNGAYIGVSAFPWMMARGIPVNPMTINIGKNILSHGSGLASAMLELNGKKFMEASKGIVSSTVGTAGSLLQATGQYIRTGDFKVAGLNGKTMEYDHIGRRNYDPTGRITKQAA